MNLGLLIKNKPQKPSKQRRSKWGVEPLLRECGQAGICIWMRDGRELVVTHPDNDATNEVVHRLEKRRAEVFAYLKYWAVDRPEMIPLARDIRRQRKMKDNEAAQAGPPLAQ